MQMNDSGPLNLARSSSQRSRHPWSRRSLIATLVAVPALVALTACSGAAPTPPSQPTVQAVSTQVVAAASPAAATAQAGASPAMATMQAGASPAMATMQAGASPAMATMQAGASPAIATMQAGASPAAAAGASLVGTAVSGMAPMASPSPSPAAQGALRIADASLADSTPWLSIQNSSEDVIPMGGWKLQVGRATAELPADAVVQPGSSLTLHAGTGLSSDDELFLGNAGDALAAAALPGTPVVLMDADGKVHAQTTVPRF